MIRARQPNLRPLNLLRLRKTPWIASASAGRSRAGGATAAMRPGRDALRPPAMAMLAAACLALGAATAVAQGSDSDEFLDGIAAVVNDGVVLKSELQQELAGVRANIRAQGLRSPPAAVLESQVLDRLILREIQLQRARRMGIEISDEQVNRALGFVARQNDVELSDLPEVLAGQGLEYALYREELRMQIVLDTLRQRDVASRVFPSSREVDDFLRSAESGEGANREYQVSHILIGTPLNATSQQREAARERAAKLRQRVLDGESFAELAIAYSEAQNALQGGSLGWRKRNALPTAFVAHVAQLQPGQVAELITTGSGVHVVRLDQTRGGEPVIQEQWELRHILLQPNEIRNDEATRAEIAGLREQILAGDSFGALARAYSADPGSASEGGTLGWVSPGDLDPAFAAGVAELEGEEISPPIRSSFGWHIAQRSGTRMQDVSEELRQENAFRALRERKVQEETQLWLQRLRAEAFVEHKK